MATQSEKLEPLPAEGGAGSVTSQDVAPSLPAEKSPEILASNDLPPSDPLGPQTVAATPTASNSDAFAELTAAHRTFVTGAPRDRTFLYALGIVLMLHTGALVGTLRFDESQSASRREREGQVDEPVTITVELVENADAKSKEKRAQIGEKIPPQPPVERPAEPQPPPQREQPAQQAQPPMKVEKAVEKPPEKPQEKPPELKAEKPPEKPAEKSAEPVKPDEGPDPLKATPELPAEPQKEASLALPSEPREQSNPAQAVPPTPPPVPIPAEFKGAAPAGKERAYAKNVRETLAKTKPQIWVRRAEVWVGFVLSPTGELKVLKIINSSRDPIFDDVILEWIKRAKFARPPADARPDDLEHVIHFVVE